MSAAAYQLAKLQPKTVRFDTGVGGLPDLTPEDVAAAMGLGSISRDVYLFMLLKYTGDKEVLHELDALILESALQYRKLFEWRDPWPENWKRSRMFYLQMARLALNEVIGENNCPTCTGRGKTMTNHICKRCKGSGKSIATVSECSRWVGISRDSWNKRWENRYCKILDRVNYLEMNGLKHVHQYLYGSFSLTL